MRFPKRMTSLLAEEIGWHLGDGSMNWYKGKGFYQLRGHLIDDRAHYETIIKQAYAKLFGIDVHLREMQSTGVFGFQIWSNPLAEYKQELGLPVGPKGECAIPFEIMHNNAWSIAALRGIFDTDGMLFLEKRRSRPYPRIEIKQASHSLAQQIQQILINNGFRATLYIDHRGSDRWRPLCVVSVRGHKMLNKWMNIIKPHNPKHIKKYHNYFKWVNVSKSNSTQQNQR